MGNCYEVAEGAHGISISSSNIGCSSRCHLLVFHLVDYSLLVAQWNANGCASRTHMFEGCSSWQASCLREFVNQLPRIDRIQQIDVTGRSIHNLKRKFLTSNCTKACWELVRIASILQRHLKLKCHGLLGWRFCDLSGKPSTYSRIICGCQRVGSSGHVLPEVESRAAVVVAKFLCELGILRRAGENGHSCVVLGRCPNHCWSTNVNILNTSCEVTTFGHRFLERVKIDNNQIDLANAVFFHFSLMSSIATGSKQATMDLRVQCLHATIQNLR
mmetsp:Transcript_23072/g.37567  ORF Transcript_23072/g.37567 Transcript_23072/m.37567 type:complete len:273 (-) Transcript_23072:257-1075(-)